MAIRIESDYSKEILKVHLEALYKHEAWYSLPKGITGKINNNKLSVGIENGIVFWLGRGKFEGKITTAENGSVLIGNLNSPKVATLTPVVFFAFLMALIPENSISLLLFGLVFCLFGFLLVKADHSQLLEVLNVAAGNGS